MRRVCSVLALALVVCVASAESPAPETVADFENPACVDSLKSGHCDLALVAEPAPGTGHALRWTLHADGESSWVDFRVAAPPDLSKNRFLQFRIRLAGEYAGPLHVRVESRSRAWLGARVRGVGRGWKTFTFDTISMECNGKFDAATVDNVSFVVFENKGGSYELDDVAFVPAMPAPSGGPAGKSAPAGDAAAKKGRQFLADFEAPEAVDFVDPHRCSVARVQAGPKEKNFVLAWTLAGGAKSSYVELYGFPRDVRESRILRFRIRADRPVAADLSVRLEAGVRDVLDGDVKGISTKWQTVELRLPEMDVMGEFDPRRVEDVVFIFFEPPEAVVQIDDVELCTGPGGWRATDAEILVHVFGEARAKKVAKIPTTHFDVLTDSAAAQSKFPLALETAHEFVTKLLRLPAMDEKLPVYIFQSSNLYEDFCVRFAGWTKEQAQRTAGHGSGRYFATYYQSPDAPTVVHELTHSLFIRTLGAQGGSWFHEGVAMYVEHAWQKQSAAELFAPSLRSGQFVHLAEFMAMPELVSEGDVKGGPRTAGRLYEQAGAFYEFLVRGPFAADASSVVAAIAHTRKTDAEGPEFAAKLLGRTLEEIETAWVAWGNDPPKAK